MLLKIDIVEGFPSREQILGSFDMFIITNLQFITSLSRMQSLSVGLLLLRRQVKLRQPLIFLFSDGKVGSSSQQDIGFKDVIQMRVGIFDLV